MNMTFTGSYTVCQGHKLDLKSNLRDPEDSIDEGVDLIMGANESSSSDIDFANPLSSVNEKDNCHTTIIQNGSVNPLSPLCNGNIVHTLDVKNQDNDLVENGNVSKHQNGYLEDEIVQTGNVNGLSDVVNASTEETVCSEQVSWDLANGI